MSVAGDASHFGWDVFCKPMKTIAIEVLWMVANLDAVADQFSLEKSRKIRTFPSVYDRQQARHLVENLVIGVSPRYRQITNMRIMQTIA